MPAVSTTIRFLEQIPRPIQAPGKSDPSSRTVFRELQNRRRNWNDFNLAQRLRRRLPDPVIGGKRHAQRPHRARPSEQYRNGLPTPASPQG